MGKFLMGLIVGLIVIPVGVLYVFLFWQRAGSDGGGADAI